MNKKWQVISSVMLIIIFICSAFMYHFIQHAQQSLDRSVDSKAESIRAIVKTIETNKNRHYRKRINNFINYKLDPSKEKTLQAFAAQDREELLRLSTPYFNLIQSEDPSFSTLAWILPNNFNLLRVHAPQISINDVSNIRPDVVKANRDYQRCSGYIIARSGLRYAIVEPVFYKGKYLGATQFGLDEDFTLESIKEQLHITVGLIIPNEKFATVTRPQLPSITGKKYTIQSHDLPIFEGENDLIDWSLEQQQVLLHGKEYVIIKTLDLPDYAGHSQGQIFAAWDISDHVADTEAQILFIFILGVVLFLASFVILYFSYGALVENIIALNRSLRRKKDEWEKTFDAMSDIVTIQDKNMRIVQANRAAHHFFQEEQEAIIGRKCFEVFRGTAAPCPGCPGFESLQDAQHHSEIVKHEKLGKIFHVSSAPVLNEKGEIQDLIHTAKDITEQKRLEEELFQSHKMEAIGTLAGGIAHDFNNILTAIVGYAEIAKDSIPADNQAIQDIDEVLKASGRATGLVKQILTFSRKSEHQLKPLSPHLIIKEALQMLRASLPATIEIQEDIDIECGEIVADPTNIHQIVVNLCTNSLHAIQDEKGMLSISLHRTEISAEEIRGEHGVSPGPFIVLKIGDTGHGMDQATMDHVFDPYFTTKEIGKGTGLGLSVIHGIIQDYHGFITVKSEPGKGTTFSVHIPALQQTTSTPDEFERDESLPGGTEQVLVVDDEIMIANLNKAVLEQLGYKVTATTKSLDALEKIRTDPDRFDLIISDQTMPNLTGAELAQEVLQIKPGMPFILCTGYSSVLSEKDALAIGIKKYARKPVNRTTLAHIIRQVLDAN